MDLYKVTQDDEDHYCYADNEKDAVEAFKDRDIIDVPVVKINNLNEVPYKDWYDYIPYGPDLGIIYDYFLDKHIAEFKETYIKRTKIYKVIYKIEVDEKITVYEIIKNLPLSEYYVKQSLNVEESE